MSDNILVLLHNGIASVIQIYSVLLIIYILMSWVPASRETKFGKILEKIAEPYLGFFRKFIPPLGMIDISPIVGIFALSLISNGVTAIFNLIL
ncbi:YggT family protein [Sporosarcina sp. ANT_H38]|uniref:YggT family protein n=1 Tax=Sporosarcina sp. ANT_H38 TaxID=2597358 RepID=UPI0011F11C69|nr:YggT family protein [Sporosarcina sp. ANT_H38]KAA0966589.1 YggT family protein [Sporosarcina sp. ANT_H38]